MDFINHARAGRTLPVEMHTPVGLLREFLNEALTGELQPPYPSRRRDEHEQQLLEQRRAAAAAAAEHDRAALSAARVEYAAAAQTSAVARIRGAALARAVLSKPIGHRAVAPSQDGSDGWPLPAEPGSGSSPTFPSDRATGTLPDTRPDKSDTRVTAEPLE